MGVIIEEIFDDEESKEVNNGAEGMSKPTTIQKDPSVRETENDVNDNNNNNTKEEVSGHGAGEEGSRAEDHSLREDNNDEDWVTVSREDANIDGSEKIVDKTNTKEDEEEEEEDDDDDMLSEEEKRAKIEQAEELKAKGNAHFSAQEYQKAIDAYTEALEMAPLSAKKERSIYFANRAACFTYLEEYDEAASDCSNALDLDTGYVKAYLRRANAFEKMEEYDKGLADAHKVLELDPGNATAKGYITRIEPLAEKKREELKEEMVEKLKDLGNSLLGNFGLSLDNFKAEKDPNTGSYSIQFNK